MLMEAAMDIYLDGLRVKEYSQETIRAYRRDLKKFQCFLMSEREGEVRIVDIMLADLESYVLYLKETCKLQPRSRNRYMSSLSAFFAYSVKRGWVSRNPALWLDAAKVYNRPMSVCTEEELCRLIEAIDQPVVRAAVEFMAKTGLRCGEATNLKVEEIDYQFERIHVIAGKGGKYRSVPIAQSLLPVMQQYEQSVRSTDSPYFFATTKTGRLSAQYINFTLKRITKELGWKKKITNHTLRRTFATNLYKRGVGLETIKTLLGHESIRTTSIYLQLQEEDLRNAVDLL